MICPGPHATDRMKELGGAGVMGDPADFGSVAAFLCSAQAGFVNGAAVVVDGGRDAGALTPIVRWPGPSAESGRQVAGPSAGSGR